MQRGDVRVHTGPRIVLQQRIVLMQPDKGAAGGRKLEIYLVEIFVGQLVPSGLLFARVGVRRQARANRIWRRNYGQDSDQAEKRSGQFVHANLFSKWNYDAKTTSEICAERASGAKAF